MTLSAILIDKFCQSPMPRSAPSNCPPVGPVRPFGTHQPAILALEFRGSSVLSVSPVVKLFAEVPRPTKDRLNFFAYEEATITCPRAAAQLPVALSEDPAIPPRVDNSLSLLPFAPAAGKLAPAANR